MTTYAKIQRLTEPRGGDIDQAFQRLVVLLRDSGRTATLRCTVLLADGQRQWTLDLQGKDSRLRSDPAQAPDLEIITAETTWWEIAEGRLSPLEAFARGRLRVRGDTELGSHLLRRIAHGGGATSICRE